MNIDREAERDISDILSNVRRQSDTGQSSYTDSAPTSGQTGWTSFADGTDSAQEVGQTSSTGGTGWTSSVAETDHTSHAGLTDSVGEASSAEAVGWFIDREGMVCEEQSTSEGVAQSVGGPPPGFPSLHPRPPDNQEEVDMDTAMPQPLLIPGGSSYGATTPTSCQAGSSEQDKKLRDELLEAQTQNKKYMKMLVSQNCGHYSVIIELYWSSFARVSFSRVPRVSF